MFGKRASVCGVGLLISLYITTSVISDLNQKQKQNPTYDVPRLWGFRLFAMHVFFMSFGALVCVPMTILLSPTPGKTPHALCSSLSATFIVMGCISIYMHKSAANLSHFSTLHSIVGLIVILATVITAIGGSLLFNFSSKIVPKTKAFLKSGHRTFGWIAFTGLAVSVFLALVSPWGVSHSILGWDIEHPEKRIVSLLSIPLIFGCTYWLFNKYDAKTVPGDHLFNLYH